MDMKNHLICVMEAIETLLEEGFTPERDVYLCFGDNEEILGEELSGARHLALALQARGVTKLESTLDEGGAMLPVHVKGILSGVLAGVGIAEKGHCDIEISVSAKGGHASQPPNHTALGELAKVIRRLEKHQFKAKMTPLMSGIIDAAGRRLPYWLRAVAVNHRLLRPLLLAVMKKIPPAACMVRTTTAVTQATGSPAPNVLPQRASVVANFRMMPGTTTQDLVAHIKKVARNKNIEVEVLRANEASKYSSVESQSFEAIRRLVTNLHPDAILAPFLVMGGTDTIKYDPICDHCYRFSPFVSDVKLLLCTHGTDERLPVAAVGEGVRFFKGYIRGAAAAY
jgi:carboxypeptidase PM20D1